MSNQICICRCLCTYIHIITVCSKLICKLRCRSSRYNLFLLCFLSGCHLCFQIGPDQIRSGCFHVSNGAIQSYDLFHISRSNLPGRILGTAITSDHHDSTAKCNHNSQNCECQNISYNITTVKYILRKEQVHVPHFQLCSSAHILHLVKLLTHFRNFLRTMLHFYYETILTLSYKVVNTLLHICYKRDCKHP